MTLSAMAQVPGFRVPGFLPFDASASNGSAPCCCAWCECPNQGLELTGTDGTPNGPFVFCFFVGPSFWETDPNEIVLGFFLYCRQPRQPLDFSWECLALARPSLSALSLGLSFSSLSLLPLQALPLLPPCVPPCPFSHSSLSPPCPPFPPSCDSPLHRLSPSPPFCPSCPFYPSSFSLFCLAFFFPFLFLCFLFI